jgi:hypothetical protein
VEIFIFSQSGFLKGELSGAFVVMRMYLPSFRHAPIIAQESPGFAMGGCNVVLGKAVRWLWKNMVNGQGSVWMKNILTSTRKM